MKVVYKPIVSDLEGIAEPVVDHQVEKPNRIDPIQAYKLRYRNGLTYDEIAEYFGVSTQAVQQRLVRLSALIHTKEQQEEYEQAKPALMSSVEQQLLATLVDQDKLAKASLNNVAYAFTQIHQAKRLEENKSTNNVGIVSKLVSTADDTLLLPKK